MAPIHSQILKNLRMNFLVILRQGASRELFCVLDRFWRFGILHVGAYLRSLSAHILDTEEVMYFDHERFVDVIKNYLQSIADIADKPYKLIFEAPYEWSVLGLLRLASLPIFVVLFICWTLLGAIVGLICLPFFTLSCVKFGRRIRSSKIAPF